MNPVRVAAVLACLGAVHSLVNARRLRTLGPGSGPGPTVLVPARDERHTIVSCVQSARGPVIVLDDGSTDGTAVLAAAAGARVLPGTPAPSGWLGKPWACAQLVGASDDDVLVFVDADVVLEPGAVAAAVRALDGFDLVSVFPRQDARGPAERLVQPLLAWSWMTTLPLDLAERSPRPSLTAACGQFVVVRRAALGRAGGFAAVRGEVVDDIALARAIKRAGGRVGLVAGHRCATTRMYDGWAEVRDGYGKSLWTAFGSPAGGLAVALGAVFVWVLPAATAVIGSRAGLVGYLAGVASRVVAARAVGDRCWPDALAHPASVGVFAYLTLRSVRDHRRGTLRWKGRPVTPGD